MENKEETKERSKIAKDRGHLIDLVQSEGWKYLCRLLDDTMADIKEQIFKPCIDHKPIYNGSNLMAERLTSLFVIRNIADGELSLLNELFVQEKEKAKPLQVILEERDKKLSEQLTKYIRS